MVIKFPISRTVAVSVFWRQRSQKLFNAAIRCGEAPTVCFSILAPCLNTWYEPVMASQNILRGNVLPRKARRSLTVEQEYFSRYK